MSVQAVKRRLNLEVASTASSQSAFKAPRVKRRRSGSNSFSNHTPSKSTYFFTTYIQSPFCIYLVTTFYSNVFNYRNSKNFSLPSVSKNYNMTVVNLTSFNHIIFVSMLFFFFFVSIKLDAHSYMVNAERTIQSYFVIIIIINLMVNI